MIVRLFSDNFLLYLNYTMLANEELFLACEAFRDRPDRDCHEDFGSDLVRLGLELRLQAIEDALIKYRLSKPDWLATLLAGEELVQTILSLVKARVIQPTSLPATTLNTYRDPQLGHRCHICHTIIAWDDNVIPKRDRRCIECLIHDGIPKSYY